MNVEKVWIDSVCLHRRAHVDVFSLGKCPRFALLFFSGSGIDEEEYAIRGKTIAPAFNQALARLDERGAEMVFLHVTAPFDVPYARFAEFPEAIETWNRHILEELLKPWSALPLFVASFSGGAALAFHGVHAAAQCFGGAALGPDSLSRQFVRPHHWRTKLILVCCRDDRVCLHSANHDAIKELIACGTADLLEYERGRHRIGDYVDAGAVADLTRIANYGIPG